MLVEHRINDVDEGLVAREQAVAAGQQVAFEPALAQMLAEHLHHPALRREMHVIGLDLLHPYTLGCLEDIVEAVWGGPLGAPPNEIAGPPISSHHVPPELGPPPP